MRRISKKWVQKWEINNPPEKCVLQNNNLFVENRRINRTKMPQHRTNRLASLITEAAAAWTASACWTWNASFAVTSSRTRPSSNTWPNFIVSRRQMSGLRPSNWFLYEARVATNQIDLIILFSSTQKPKFSQSFIIIFNCNQKKTYKTQTFIFTTFLFASLKNNNMKTCGNRRRRRAAKQRWTTIIDNKARNWIRREFRSPAMKCDLCRLCTISWAQVYRIWKK